MKLGHRQLFDDEVALSLKNKTVFCPLEDKAAPPPATRGRNHIATQE
jgi:hypothetical protein